LAIFITGCSRGIWEEDGSQISMIGLYHVGYHPFPILVHVQLEAKGKSMINGGGTILPIHLDVSWLVMIKPHLR
jgi:hypothetical protein